MIDTPQFETKSDKLILKSSGALTVIAQRVGDKSEVVDIAFGDAGQIKQDLESQGYSVKLT